MSVPKTVALTVMIALVALGTASRAQAQTTVRAKIPFRFSLGGEMYPSGTYTLTTTASHRSVLAVWNSDGKVAAFIPVQPEGQPPGAEAEKSSLTFRRYGDHYFLARVDIAGEDVGLTLRRGRAEREIVASADLSSEVVVVAANR
jgi:hypothetical protein